MSVILLHLDTAETEKVQLSESFN